MHEIQAIEILPSCQISPHAQGMSKKPRPTPTAASVWKSLADGLTVAQVARRFHSSIEQVVAILEADPNRVAAQEHVRQSIPAPTRRPAPQTSPLAETAWELVHGRRLPIRTVASRLGIPTSEVFELLAAHTPIVREREWAALKQAGEDPNGRSDWTAQRTEAHARRVGELRAQGLTQEIIAERLGETENYINQIIQKIHHINHSKDSATS